MLVTLINFNNLNLDFSNNYFVRLGFDFKNITYNLAVVKNSSDDLIIYCQDNFIIKSPTLNTFYKARNFDIAFVIENFLEVGLVDDKDFNEATIFNKYKLGLFYNAQ